MNRCPDCGVSLDYAKVSHEKEVCQMGMHERMEWVTTTKCQCGYEDIEVDTDYEGDDNE